MTTKLLVRVALWSALALSTALLAGLLFLFSSLFGGDGVLASLRLPDGSEYMVTQQNNHDVWEPFTVAFYMRSSTDSPWGWCYIDHQASRWSGVAMTYDARTDTVVVTERGTRRAALDRNRGTFWKNNGNGGYALPAPQESNSRPDFPFPPA